MILAYGITAIVVFVVVSLIFGPIPGIIVAIPVAIFLPKGVIRYFLQRRWLQIESQLPYAVDQIVSAVRTGKPLAIAVNAVADTGQMLKPRASSSALPANRSSASAWSRRSTAMAAMCRACTSRWSMRHSVSLPARAATFPSR